MFKQNPEEFISKVSEYINEEKATIIVKHISYREIEGKYDTDIFTLENRGKNFKDAFKAKKHIQDYVFTDGISKKSVERKFVENIDVAEDIIVYAKLPKGFYIPTPVGNYSPDWAISFKEGEIKHSVIFSGVKVGKNTKIIDSIIMADTEIGNNVTIRKAIIANNVKITDNINIGDGEKIAVVGEKKIIDSQSLVK